MNREELKEILDLHEKWLNNETDGLQADLSDADLTGANLSGANLTGANLSGANLSDANLRHVKLSEANLRHANLSGANLGGADLGYANLNGANLSDTNLRNANLRHVKLSDADLSDADLSGANLTGANLRNVNLSKVFYDIYTSSYAIQCPETGSFTAYKKAGWYIVELLIPKSAKRSSATSRKCRADKAKVVAIYNEDRTKADIKAVKSDYDSKFIYEIGKTVSVKDFDNDRWNECSTGIHFFITFDEAKNY